VVDLYFLFLSPCFDDPRFKATFNLTLEHPDLTYGVSTTEIFVN
jgi:hypothetical protein